MLEHASGRLLTDQALTQFALGIDNVGDRQDIGAWQFEARRRILRQHGEADIEAVRRALEVIALQGIEVDANHPRRLVFQRFFQRVELGNLGATRRAPFGPIIDDQPLAIEAVSRYLSSMLVRAEIFGASR
eukprot:GHVR01066667.1.p2 GENE.GHVR01066667.1~~GHVR01066667.1.p2  ORF type:complete len:131 (+),score=21.93 GHVR01066667.1:47-439(+)